MMLDGILGLERAAADGILEVFAEGPKARFWMVKTMVKTRPLWFHLAMDKLE